MKNKILLFLILICCSFVVSAQNKLFDRFCDMDGVTSVNISKAMLQMMPNMKNNGIDISSIVGKLESLQILSTEKAYIAKKMKEEAGYITQNKSYEELMKVKDEGAKVTFYIKKNGEKIRELVMLVDKTSKFVMISIIGDMTLTDVQNITKQ